MLHIVNLSYGTGSYIAAKRVIAEVGADSVITVFADTKYEDEDTYAWGKAAVAKLGCKHVVISDGRDPWELFHDERFLGNSRADPCSKILKRQLSDRWLRENYQSGYGPWPFVLVFGIHWSESDRWERRDRETGERRGIKPRMDTQGIMARAPLCEPRYLIGAAEMQAEVEADGLWTQKLYRLGFPHANCGGRCVKQGQGGWALLYRTMPERFTETMRREEEFRRWIGKDVAMCHEVVRGVKRPLPLVELKRRIDEADEMPLFDGAMGGCSCFAGDE